MRIAFDAYWWVNGPQSMANVLRGVVETWSREFPDDELVLIVRKKHSPQLGVMPKNVSVRQSRAWPQAVMAIMAVPLWAYRTRCDAMMVHSFAPLFGRRRAVLLHDAMYMTNPEWFTRMELLYFRWMARLAGRAHVVFATTETEAARIARVTSAKKVIPIGMGLTQQLLSGPSVKVNGLEPFRFILVVGRLNLRKNLAITLEGVRASGMLSPDNPFVIVGEQQGAVAALPGWVGTSEASGEVRFTGFVSNANLRWLLENCALFVSLSLDEGFGLPPVEARALGAPVLVSDRPIFRETLDAQAEFVEPTDIDAIGRKIQAILAGPSTRTSPPSSETARIVDRYNWSDTVKNIREELTRA